MQLLRKLLDSLSMTCRAYKRFDASDGDKHYFSNILDPDTNLVQNNIKESFEKLADIYLQLTSLDDSCKRFATHVGTVQSTTQSLLTLDPAWTYLES
jgi:hypothetical protein